MEKISIIKGEVISLLYKNAYWIGLLLLGLGGRFCYDLLQNKKLSKLYIVGCTGCGFFVGAMTWIICHKYKLENGVIYVPLCTLLGQNIMSFVVLKWQDILSKDWDSIFKEFTKKK